jgi:cytochrome c-type biogenesis protein CcmH
MSASRVRRLRVAGLWLVLLSSAPAPAAEGQALPGERALLQRLFSPCCYRETLDVHESPVADELRLEIHGRLARGEPSDAIVADMVARYGDDVLTRPPRAMTALGLFAGAGGLVALLVAFALRRGRVGAAPRLHPGDLEQPAGERLRLEERLEDELAALD